MSAVAQNQTPEMPAPILFTDSAAAKVWTGDVRTVGEFALNTIKHKASFQGKPVDVPGLASLPESKST